MAEMSIVEYRKNGASENRVDSMVRHLGVVAKERREAQRERERSEGEKHRKLEMTRLADLTVSALFRYKQVQKMKPQGTEVYRGGSLAVRPSDCRSMS